MTEKIIMPKNVQSFVDKYGGIGSKEQNSAFWKEFRKAANAYANVQAKRICDLEHTLAESRKLETELAAVTEQLNEMTLRWELTNDSLFDKRDMVDRLAEALQSVKCELGVPQPEYPSPVANAYWIADKALQSLSPDHTVAANDMIANQPTKP